MASPLPATYAWLPRVEGLPRMVDEALKLFGSLEAPGAADNPQILAWAREVGLSGTYSHDSVPWCGLFAALVAKRAGWQPPTEPLWALNWNLFGQKVQAPALGDILVFKRPGGGHVGLYVGEDAAAWHVLGGNTADAVGIARIGRPRLVAARRPPYHIPPAGARAFQLAVAGSLSVNEA